MAFCVFGILQKIRPDATFACPDVFGQAVGNGEMLKSRRYRNRPGV